MTARRPWVLPPWVVGAALVASIAWALWDPLAAELRAPADAALNWFYAYPILLVLGGVVQYVRNGWPPRRALIWPVMVPFWLLGLGTATTLCCSAWPNVGYVEFLLALAVLLMVAVASILLIQVAAGFRRVYDFGRCSVCGYDLTGNETGVCPECGEGVVQDAEVPREYYGRRHWILPELAQFSDARARWRAYLEAAQATRRPLLGWLFGGAAVLWFAGSLTVALAYQDDSFAKNVWLIGSLVIFAPAGLRWRRTLRRTLRDQLRRMRSGEDRPAGPA
jgi:hypothetical protein